MKNWFIPSKENAAAGSALIGGKGAALAGLLNDGFAVPDLLCVTTRAYRQYAETTGVGDRILLELARKDFADMRWEEIWDVSLRIRHLFVTTPLPKAMADELQHILSETFADRPVAVRSSAPGEDDAASSFAGLHESYLNVKGPEAILDAVKRVWASLWSHRALLYRRELGLDVSRSAMAVVVQRLVCGASSGVVFSRDPTRPSRSVVEAVHGLNEGLVDGQIEPDRWIFDRRDGTILNHAQPVRTQRMAPRAEGTALEPLPTELTRRPPLTDTQAAEVWRLGRAAEEHAGSPQDVEWTLLDNSLITLQARPITSLEEDTGDSERQWYLSLERSLENLQQLRRHIEEHMLPGMTADADRLSRTEPLRLDDLALAESLDSCVSTYEHWRKEYWEYCIPFAHGIRLFGEIYTDNMRPDDPYEFLALLRDDRMLSVERNRRLQQMAEILRQNETAARTAGEGHVPETLREDLEQFLQRFGATMQLGLGQDDDQLVDTLLHLLVRLARSEAKQVAETMDQSELHADFIASFPDERRQWAKELLELGRASYRLRDDDNLYIGRVEAELERIAAEARRRLAGDFGSRTRSLSPSVLAALLRDPDALVPPGIEDRPATADETRVRYRQLVGQPAGPGTAEGRARVVTCAADLDAFEEGDVLVCDAVDPTITFVVPLARAVVERRGGMLIHGAIIAREYGLPCVTGIPGATERIPDGAAITVDGYLGIVTVDTERKRAP